MSKRTSVQPFPEAIHSEAVCGIKNLQFSLRAAMCITFTLIIKFNLFFAIRKVSCQNNNLHFFDSYLYLSVQAINSLLLQIYGILLENI